MGNNNSPDYDAIIVGSGAGGGPLCYELAKAGKKVALIEAGGFYTTNDFNRFELLQLRKLWWKARWTANHEIGYHDEIALGMGRCVGGGTTIFTAVASRAPEFNFAEWHEATGIENENGEAFSFQDLLPYYEELERETGVRKYTEWDDGLKKINSGFSKIGHPFTPVDAYISERCDQSGCLYGCPTEAKRGTLVTYVIPAMYLGAQVFPNSVVTRILFSEKMTSDGEKKPKAIGVEFVNENNELARFYSKIVIVAAGAMNTPTLLLDSGIRDLVGDTRSVNQIGSNFAANTAAIVFGRFPDVLKNWLMHPLSGHVMDFIREEKGGFLLEASEVMEGPLGFAEFMVDEEGVPLWGRRQKEIMKNYKHYAGIFINIHDGNDGRIFKDSGLEKIYKPVTSSDFEKFKKAREICKEGLAAAGAMETLDTSFISHHVQGSCRMGEDLSRSVVDSNCESHDVRNLFVADGSLIPTVIDVNPSLTIMALSKRLAKHLISSSRL